MNEYDFARAHERAEQAAYARHFDVPDRCQVCGREGTELCVRCERVSE